MNFKEVRDLLKMMNVDMNEHHAHRLFTVRAVELNTNYGHSCNLSIQHRMFGVYGNFPKTSLRPL